MFNVSKYGYKSLLRNSYDTVPKLTNFADALANSNFTPLNIDTKRTALDRVFDTLSVGNYVSAGLVRGLLPGNDINVFEGITGGLRAANPFGDGYEKGEHTYGKVLEDMGWKPQSTLGKIAKGTVGLVGDVFLDPTTYLTLGGSAIVKGTGKAGMTATHAKGLVKEVAEKYGVDMAKKSVSELPGEVYKNIIGKYASNPNINKELVERLATKKADEVFDTVASISNGMSTDVAKNIITKYNAERGIALGAEELSNSANKLAKEYNRIAGIRDVASDATLSLGNAPFGKKLFGEHANKSITLADGATLQKIGDKTLAPQYAKLRNSVYGSKLGKLFSTKSSLFNLSKTNPEAVYEFLRFAEHTRSLTKDIRLAKKAIYDKAKELELTPDETKEVITLMEDKSYWSNVQKAVDVSDTIDYKMQLKNFNEKIEADKLALEDLYAKRNNLDMLTSAQDAELLDLDSVVHKLGNNYRKSLLKLQTKRITKQDDLLKLIDMYKDEIGRFDSAENLYKETGILEKTSDDVIADIDKYFSKSDNVDGAIDKGSFVNTLSRHIYGVDGYITPTAWDSHLKGLSDLIKKGANKDEILSFIDDKYDFLISGRAQEIYPFIAEQIGYGKGTSFKNWDEFYTNRMNKLVDKIDAGKELTREEALLSIELNKKKIKRIELMREFDGASSIEDVMKIKTNYANNALEKIADEVDSFAYSTDKNAAYSSKNKSYDEMRKTRMIGEDYASEATSSVKRRTDKTGEFVDHSISGKTLTTGDKEEVISDLVDHVFYNSKYTNPKSATSNMGDKSLVLNNTEMKWINKVYDEIAPLLENFFKKDITKLSDNEKRLLYDTAVQNATKRFENGNYFDSVAKDAVSKARFKAFADEAKKRINVLREDSLLKKVKQGSQVEFKTLGKNYSGVVDTVSFDKDGKMALNIVTNDGKLIKNVGINRVTGLHTDAKILTPDEIVRQSNIATDFIAEREELFKKLDDAKNKLKTMSKTEINKTHAFKTVTKKYTDEVTKIKEQIKQIEVDKQGLRESFLSENDKAIEALSKSIKDSEELLNNQDALDTYLRSAVENSDFTVEVFSYNTFSPDSISYIMLNHDETVSDKVVKIAEQLRNDLFNMGVEEVSIGKLKSEQLTNFMHSYLPHILTDEGKKIFENTDELVKRVPQFGDMLGFGREFNEFSLSRTIKEIPGSDGKMIRNPNILQLNEFFGDKFADILKGKNAFVDDLSDIYLARALKHVDLMYDNEYMYTMMDTFGSTMRVGSDVREGYKAVSNYGELRNFIQSRARTLSNLEVEHMKQSGLSVDDAVSEKLYQKHLTNTLNEFGLPVKTLDNFAMPMVELNKEQISKLQQVEPSLVKEINESIVNKSNQSRKSQIIKDQNRFLQLYDKFTHLIKLNQTTVLPSFHMRNKMSNTFNNWLEVGADAVNVDFQKAAYRAVKSDGNISDVLKITKADGSVDSIGWDELYRNAKDYGVIDEGYYAKDLGAGAMSNGVMKKLPVGYDPTDTKNFKLYKMGANFGGTIENQDRLIHFASQVSRGMSFEEAAESVEKFLFDYSDLTAFEQNVMKRIIPYYTWLRKNSALQLEMLLDNPKKYKYIAQTEHAIESGVNDDERINKAFVNDFAKDWVQTPFFVNNPEGRREPVLWNPNLPFMDLGRIPDPTQPVQSLKELFTQTNPIIKTPIEQLINKNVFFDSPITKDSDSTGEALGKRAEHILSQLALYNTGKDFIKKSDADLGLHTMNTLSGVKMLSYDYDKYKAMKIQELLKEMEDKK